MQLRKCDLVGALPEAVCFERFEKNVEKDLAKEVELELGPRISKLCYLKVKRCVG